MNQLQRDNARVLSDDENDNNTSTTMCTTMCTYTWCLSLHLTPSLQSSLFSLRKNNKQKPTDSCYFTRVKILTLWLLSGSFISAFNVISATKQNSRRIEKSVNLVRTAQDAALTPGHMSPGNMYLRRATCIRTQYRGLCRRIHFAGNKLFVWAWA